MPLRHDGGHDANIQIINAASPEVRNINNAITGPCSGTRVLDNASSAVGSKRRVVQFLVLQINFFIFSDVSSEITLMPSANR